MHNERDKKLQIYSTIICVVQCITCNMKQGQQRKHNERKYWGEQKHESHVEPNYYVQQKLT